MHATSFSVSVFRDGGSSSGEMNVCFSLQLSLLRGQVTTNQILIWSSGKRSQQFGFDQLFFSFGVESNLVVFGSH